jgi:RsiW-degrading membrane proteinase PrsW (M82 family)
MNYLFFLSAVFFGVLPSLIWLLFYLREDVRPEPKAMVLKIFFLGGLVVFPGFFVENEILRLMENFNFSLFWKNILGIALVEEFFKFLVVFLFVLKNPEFDEPVDAMIYMIVSALGFAAVENVLILFSVPPFFSNIFEFSLIRFLGATFLHALASATLGFFLALSFFQRKKLIWLGFILAVFLHGLYNFFIMVGREGGIFTFFPTFLLFLAVVLISFGFQKLKRSWPISGKN